MDLLEQELAEEKKATIEWNQKLGLKNIDKNVYIRFTKFSILFYNLYPRLNLFMLWMTCLSMNVICVKKNIITQREM